MAEFPELLRISQRIVALPVIHGSGQCAALVRRWFLEHEFDCVALPLPESFREAVEEAVLDLPRPAIVIQHPRPTLNFELTEWQAEDAEESFDVDEDAFVPHGYVPIDPCQPVIMAIRAAIGEHIPRAYIDLETEQFLPDASLMPDPYALRTVSPDRFAAAMLPSIPEPSTIQGRQRVRVMAQRLHELEQRFERILLVCGVTHWPWIHAAYQENFGPLSLKQRNNANPQRAIDRDTETTESFSEEADTPEDLIDDPLLSSDEVESPVTYAVDPKTLMFLFGELPFITSLYERARRQLDEDDNLQIDGVKELLIAARESYRADLGKRARRISPHGLRQCLKYIRNLSLLGKRMTPDLYTIVTAAKQIFGDQYALHVVETARRYEPSGSNPLQPQAALGIDQARLPDGDVIPLVNRLPGPPMLWRTVHLNRRPTDDEKKQWSYAWNPFGQCSYPPEDELIERFRSRAFERAKAIIGADLAKTEKFTTSVKDGIDIRDTLRHWYSGDIYVKIIPPNRGAMDACVMLFDSPADPRDYPWRTTWFAEHNEESTLAFYGTDFRQELVGPGICLATYGGVMFLFPPIDIPDIWRDRRLDFVETLEERLIAAACMYSRGKQIALVSSLPPGGGWRRLARRFRKQLIHVPMASFSEAEVSQLRMVHVLNGTQVRSYAEHFIRKA